MSSPKMQRPDFSSMKSSLGSARQMPESIQRKMETSFRTDLSGVDLYESPLVAKHGANAAASGQSIAFAPGKLDFSSRSGQSLLGHELSHIVSQSKGEVSGHGVVRDHGLEAKADAEGAKAASMSDFDSMPDGLSPMGAGIAASAPVQCRKLTDKEKMAQQEFSQSQIDLARAQGKLTEEEEAMTDEEWYASRQIPLVNDAGEQVYEDGTVGHARNSIDKKGKTKWQVLEEVRRINATRVPLMTNRARDYHPSTLKHFKDINTGYHAYTQESRPVYGEDGKVLMKDGKVVTKKRDLKAEAKEHRKNLNPDNRDSIQNAYGKLRFIKSHQIKKAYRRQRAIDDISTTEEIGDLFDDDEHDDDDDDEQTDNVVKNSSSDPQNAPTSPPPVNPDKEIDDLLSKEGISPSFFKEEEEEEEEEPQLTKAQKKQEDREWADNMIKSVANPEEEGHKIIGNDPWNISSSEKSTKLSSTSKKKFSLVMPKRSLKKRIKNAFYSSLYGTAKAFTPVQDWWRTIMK